MITYVFWWLWCSSAVKGLWSRFLWLSCCITERFYFPMSDTSCEINNFPRCVPLVCQQSFHQSFSNARCGTNISHTVCLSAFLLRPSFSVWVLFLFSAPFPFRWRRGGSLDCEAPPSTDVEIVRNFSVEWRRNLTKLREGCFDERTGWGANHV